MLSWTVITTRVSISKHSKTARHRNSQPINDFGQSMAKYKMKKWQTL
jgi:hypothetical protein